MALVEGQYKVGGLLIGPGTRYELLRDGNFWSRSARADMGGVRAWNHGTWSGAEWGNEAVVPLPIMVRGVTADIAGWTAAHQPLAAAFAPVGVGGDVELRWCLGGREYVMYGRPRMMEPDASTIALGYARTQCAFVAQSPFYYAGTESVTAAITPPSYTGGLTFPVTFPLTFNSTLAGGEATLTNDGTVATGLLLRVDGPCVDPTVIVVQGSTALTLTVGMTVSAGSYLEIDTTARTVLLDGTVNRRGDMYGDWPQAPVGTSTVRYRVGSGAGSLTARYRPAWW